MLSFKRTILYVLIFGQLALSLSVLGVSWFHFYDTEPKVDGKEQYMNLWGYNVRDRNHYSWADYKDVVLSKLDNPRKECKQKVATALSAATGFALLGAVATFSAFTMYTWMYFSRSCTHRRRFIHWVLFGFQTGAFVAIAFSWIIWALAAGYACKGSAGAGRDTPMLDEGKHEGGFYLQVINTAVNIIVFALIIVRYDIEDHEPERKADGSLLKQNDTVPPHPWGVKRSVLFYTLIGGIVLNIITVAAPWMASKDKSLSGTGKMSRFTGTLFGIQKEGTLIMWYDVTSDACKFRGIAEHAIGMTCTHLVGLAVAIIVWIWLGAKNFSTYCTGPDMKWSHWVLLFGHLFGSACQLISWVLFVSGFRHMKCEKPLSDDYDLGAGFAIAIVNSIVNFIIAIFFILRWDEFKGLRPKTVDVEEES